MVIFHGSFQKCIFQMCISIFVKSFFFFKSIFLECVFHLGYRESDNISWQSAFLKNKSVGLFVESVFFKSVFHLGLSVGDRESDYISWELVSFKIVFYESVFFKIVFFKIVQ